MKNIGGNMRRLRKLAFYSVFLALPLTNLAQVQNVYAAPVEGTHEIQVAAGYNRQIGSGSGTFNADVGYGYYLDKAWEVGVRQQFSYTLVKEDSDIWLATTAPFIDYHFNAWGRDQNVVPFIGAILGAVWNEDDFTGTVGPEAGLKVYLSNDTFISARYNYQWFFDEIDEVNKTLDSAHIVAVGLGFNWR